MDYLGQHSGIPEIQQETIRAGIGLFEINFPTKKFHNQQIWGPFDVRVYGDDSYNVGNTNYTYDWRTGASGYIEFYADTKTDVATAWMPDDVWWHNRLYLMDTPWMTAITLRTKEGTIPGSVIAVEIECMRERLKEMRPIHKVMVDGVEKCFFQGKDSKEEAINEMENMKAEQQTVIITDGKMVPAKVKRHKYEVVAGEILGYKPEIEELIRRYSHKQYGWTSCERFFNEIKPEIIEMAAEKTEGMKKSGNVDLSAVFTQLPDLIKTMAPAERAALREALLGDNLSDSSENPDLKEEEETVT